MVHLAEYKLKIFTDALQIHFDQEPISDIAEDDLAVFAGDWTLYNESGSDIAADLIEVQRGIRKGRRKLAQQKRNKTEAGKAAKKAWNASTQAKEAKQAWRHSEAGKEAKQAWRHSEPGKEAKKAWRRSSKASKKTWKKSETGKLSTNATKRKQTLDRYLNRRIVSLDSEGRAPLHTIDSKGRAPLDAYKETSIVSKHLKKDSSGHYWEPHELSLIGAATINRPYGTPIEGAAGLGRHSTQAAIRASLRVSSVTGRLL
jgi:hypothetical protein